MNNELDLPKKTLIRTVTRGCARKHFGGLMSAALAWGLVYQTNAGTPTFTTFDFPGGRRFHFADPSGNELAVWSNV